MQHCLSDFSCVHEASLDLMYTVQSVCTLPLHQLNCLLFLPELCSAEIVKLAACFYQPKEACCLALLFGRWTLAPTCSCLSLSSLL